MKKSVNVVCAAAAMFWFAGTASATPVTFQGGEFEVTVTDLGSDIYRFVYTADFTGWDDSTSDDFITAIEFGFPGWNDVDTVTMVSETAPGDWTVMQGNASANNCNGNTQQSKICAQESSLLLSASTDDDQIYAWTVDVAYNTLGNLGALTSNTNLIQAVFYELDCKTNNRTGVETCEPKQTGKMALATDYGGTESTTGDAIVPEPTMMTLLGGGLLLLSYRLRRRSN